MAKNSVRDDVVKKYRTMYQRKLITDTQLQKLVTKGVITQNEYELIIAEENK